MARAFTAGERTDIAATGVYHDVKLELMNYSGTWIDRTSWLIEGSLEEDVDAHSMILNLTLQRDDGSTASWAPLRTDSTLNVDDAAAYQPGLDVARQWRLSFSVVSTGEVASYKVVGQGYYDIIDIGHPTPTVQLIGRDSGALLLDRWIEEERSYGDDTTPVAMETVLQRILDDNGFSSITLYTPTSPSFVLKKFSIADMSVMAALNLVASRAGFVVRYRFDASDVFRLTLYTPNRAAAPGAEVWTLGPAEYTNIPLVRMDISGVRNKIVVSYYDLAATETLTVTSENTTSQLRYGGIPRVLQIDLAQDPNLQTSARATALADAILSDLETPTLEQQVEVPGFWIAQLGDYGKFSANSVHYNTDQYGGVTHIRHHVRAGTIRTYLNVRGAPAGRYKSWLANVTIQGVPNLAIKNFREIERTDTQVTFGWENAGLVNELWYHLVTSQQPIASDPWPALNSDPTGRLTSTTTDFDVTLPDFGYITLFQLFSVDTEGNVSKPWRATIASQDAPRLQQRATQTGGDATTVTITVAVADPQPRSAISITHAISGATSSLASPQSIAAGSVTSDITTTGTVVYVITRGTSNGRITFTASATDRITDTDAVDIPALETIPQGTVTVDSNGAVSVQVDGAAWVASYKYATSNSAFPSDATARSGTTANGRQLSLTAVDTLTFGESIYITLLPYSATAAGGTEGSSIRLRGAYQTFTATKTAYFGAQSMRVSAGAISMSGANVRVSAGAFPATASLAFYPTLPIGITMVEFGNYCYTKTGTTSASYVQAKVYSGIGSDSPAIVYEADSVHNTGWQTATDSMSGAWGSNLTFAVNLSAEAAADNVEAAYVYLTYTMPDPAKTL